MVADFSSLSLPLCGTCSRFPDIYRKFFCSDCKCGSCMSCRHHLSGLVSLLICKFYTAKVHSLLSPMHSSKHLGHRFFSSISCRHFPQTFRLHLLQTPRPACDVIEWPHESTTDSNSSISNHSNQQTHCICRILESSPKSGFPTLRHRPCTPCIWNRILAFQLFCIR